MSAAEISIGIFPMDKFCKIIISTGFENYS